MNENKTVSFTGHRPDKLFGTYEINNDRAKLLMSELMKVIEQLIQEKNVTRFVSGGALGTDQLAFMAVHQMKKKYPTIENILAVPFANQAAVWKKETDIKRYEKIKQLADTTVYVDEIDHYNVDKKVEIGEYSARKLQLRNIYMVDQSDIVVAVFDGTEGGTKNCLNYAVKKEKEIIVLNPTLEFKLDRQLLK